MFGNIAATSGGFVGHITRYDADTDTASVYFHSNTNGPYPSISTDFASVGGTTLKAKEDCWVYYTSANTRQTLNAGQSLQLAWNSWFYITPR